MPLHKGEPMKYYAAVYYLGGYKTAHSEFNTLEECKTYFENYKKQNPAFKGSLEIYDTATKAEIFCEII